MTVRSFFAAFLFLIIAFPVTAQEKSLEIAEAKLGKDVQNREVVTDTTGFAVGDRVYLWLKVTGGPSDSLTVTWKTGDQTWTSKLNIGGSPWRTWAYKTAYSAGEWTVTVTDAAGTALKEMSFTVAEKK